jgi:sulfate adenylyltransferase subunit 1
MSTLLRLATAGSVDDGKSTLVGRLLHDSKSVLADQLDAVERVSRDRGLTSADLALLTDGLRAEREQGITIDVAYRYFATAHRSFVLADCPGHVQYTRNTVTGSSTADAVVLLVDARKGVLEQTRRHLAVAALMRVPHVVVAVNKIDLVDHSEDVFRSVAADVRSLAVELGIADAHAVPVSALVGDNVVDRSTNTPWYGGPSLLELLEALPPDTDPAHESFRMPVQVVVRPQGAARSPEHVEYRGYAGQLASGWVRVGDEVVVLPSGTRTTVSGIDLGERSLDVAVAPQSVTIRLTDDVDVSRGDLLCTASDPVPLRQEVQALACWLGDEPLHPGARLLVKHGSRTVLAMVRSVDGRLDLDAMRLTPADRLQLNDIGRVTVRFASSLPVEDYSSSRRGGAFLLVDPDDGRTLAAVMAGALAPGEHPG